MEGQERLTKLLAQAGAQPHTETRARGLLRAGDLALAHGDYDAARTLLEEALLLWQELGDPWGVGESLMSLGNVACGQGDDRAARTLLEESQAIFRAEGYKCPLADSLSDLGGVARREGDYEQAAALYEESLALYRELGKREANVANELRHLGHVAHYQGNTARASSLFKESLTILREPERVTTFAYKGYKQIIAGCLVGLAGVAGAAGQPARAAQLLGASEALLEAIGAVWEPADRAEYQCYVAAVRAHLDEATFAAAWAEGRTMTLEQAIHEALEEARRE